MSERDDDLRLERELRGVLRDRDPGPAPYGLLERVDRVPETARRASGDHRRAVVPLLGLAAALVIVAIGVQVLGQLPLDGAAGVSPVGSSTAAPVPGATPAPAFDPLLDGPGISATEDGSPALLVVIAVMVLGILGVALHGWRRVLPLVPAAALIAYALVATMLPVSVQVYAYGPGLNVVAARTVPGSDEVLWYELAPPDGRFSVAMVLFADAPVPVRLDGILEPNHGQEPYFGVTWQAVWLDAEPNGGSTGPAEPLTPAEIPRLGLRMLLVGEASPCAIGPAFDPETATEFGAAFTEPGPITLRISVLGWSRAIPLEFEPRLVEPITDPCPGPTPAADRSLLP